MRSAAVFASCLGVVFLCSPHLAADQSQKRREREAAQAGGVFVRDWARYPALVQRTTTAQIVALGDVHGDYKGFVTLLRGAGLIRPDASAEGGHSWAGANRLLVCTGDLIDKGDQSLPLLDLVMSLERGAAAAGGEVIVTLGNQEAEFLAKPRRKKATAFSAELSAKGLEPTAFAANSAYGTWMKQRPVAARVNSWFFAHGGNTSGRTPDELARLFKAAVDAGRWDARFVTAYDSILMDQKWWTERTAVETNLRALAVRHIVFGHDPGAAKAGPEGLKNEIREKYGGRIFAIDVGMSPAVNNSGGALLVIDRLDQGEVAMSVTAGGEKRELWRSKPTGPRSSPTPALRPEGR
jgi:hypothetical protein